MFVYINQVFFSRYRADITRPKEGVDGHIWILRGLPSMELLIMH